MKIIELTVWDTNDYGRVKVYFAITLLNLCFVWGSNRSGWLLRLGSWSGGGWDFGPGTSTGV